MIEYLFLDLDDTILDFHKAEAVALDRTFRELGVEPNAEITQRYKQINIEHWKMLERGEISREQVKILRFSALFAEMELGLDPRQTTEIYEKHLAVGHWFLPGAEAAVKALARKYRLFLASNGTASVQAGRLASADLYRYFEQVFVSEEIGHNKPSKAYFDVCFSRIDGFESKKAMIVGDSLTSDIRGGRNAGILTCWVNPGHRLPEPETTPDYEIESLARLEALLEQI